MTDIIIFDKYEIQKGILSNATSKTCPYWEDRHYEDLSGVVKYEFYCANRHKASSYLELNGYVAVKNYDGNLQLFQIKQIKKSRDSIYVDAINAVADDLHDSIIRPAVLNANTAEQAVSFVLQNTRWDVGIVEWLGVNDFTFDSYPSALSALLNIAETFSGEISYRIELQGNRVVARYIDLIQERGNHTGKRFEYGKDIVNIERTQSDEEDVVTALIGLGPSLSGEQGRMTFETVEASDKPLGDDFIGDEEALQTWGKNGKHRMGVFEYGEAQTPQELLIKTREELAKRKEPQIIYDMQVVLLEKLTGYEHEKVRLGDTVVVIDKTFEPAIAVTARVIELTRSYSNPANDDVKLGNFKPIESRFTLNDLRNTIAANSGIWTETGTKVIRGEIPPIDTSTIWAKPVSVNGTSLNVFHSYNGAIWVPTASQNANDVVFGDSESLENQRGKLFPSGVNGGLVISEDGRNLMARVKNSFGSTYDRRIIGIDDTVATMWDGNMINPKVVGWGKHYTQRVSIYIPAGTYNTGNFLEYSV